MHLDLFASFLGKIAAGLSTADSILFRTATMIAYIIHQYIYLYLYIYIYIYIVLVVSYRQDFLSMIHASCHLAHKLSINYLDVTIQFSFKSTPKHNIL